jgi:hypothetical protein
MIDTCCVASFASITYSTCILNSLRFGFGKHIWDVHVTTLMNISHPRQVIAILVVYPILVFFIKLSILLLYYRLFWVNHLQRRGVVIGIVVMILFYVPYLGSQIYAVITCTSEYQIAHDNFCRTENWTTLSGGVLNVLTDFYILIIPLPCLLKLEIQIRQKIGLCCIFLAGLVACIISIARVIIMAKTLKLTDFAWNIALTTELS